MKREKSVLSDDQKPKKQAKNRVKKTPRKPRIEKTVNAALIESFVFRFVKDNPGKFPTAKHIERELGISAETVGKYLDGMDLRRICGAHLSKAMLEQVLWGLFLCAKKGSNDKAIKLWLNLVFNWVETQALQHSGEIKTDSKLEVLIIKKDADPISEKKP